MGTVYAKSPATESDILRDKMERYCKKHLTSRSF